MRRRTEVTLAFASAGFALGMLCFMLWALAAEPTNAAQPTAISLLLLSLAGALIMWVLGRAWSRRLPATQAAELRYGPLRLFLILAGPVAVALLALRALMSG